MVSEYKNNSCKYRLGKLDRAVYLIAEEDLRDIHIDNGYAYVDGVSATPLSLQVYNISLKDTDELDERYKFTHTLTFSMHGYANYTDFQGKYYAIVKSLDGVYWLVNPLFPCKVTYTYTLDGSGSHTDFTMATISNHPTLRLQGFNAPTPSNNCKYQRCTIDRLRLNEKEYTRKTGDIVRYTNDGFKDIVYLKNSAVFKETFDGNNISHSLDFNINFDDYKSSWHYNLLEFMNNRYAAIIKTSCGKYILTGFGFGLNPSFNVDASDTGIDTISISMSDLHDNGDFIWYDDSVTITTSSGTNFVYVPECYQCVGDYLANYLLKEEVDAFGNPMGNYLVLDGHQSEFPDLNIVGVFEETEEFYNPDCEQCKLQTSFPLSFIFNTTVCRTYSLIGATDWTLSSSSNDVTVFPTSGEAETPYEIQICNNHTPSETAWTATITATYCNKTRTYDVTVIKGDGCFTAGQVFDISANGQYVVIPTQCCVSSVTESSSTITNIQIQNNYIRVYVPQNDTSSVRVFTLDVTFCDGGNGVVTINQGLGFEKWLFEYYVCSGGKKCEVWRKYTGLTAADCNEWTTFTRTQNCVDSDECSGIMTRWIDTTGTTCSNDRKYVIQEEQISTDDGETWSPTGSKRLGAETPDSPAECEGAEVEEEWRVVDNDYWCEDTTKYTKERLYTRVVGSEEWIATDTYRKGETVLEVDSVDCGFEVPSDSWECEKWETVDGYICEETTKYNKEERFVRNCSGGCSACTSAETWISTGIYRRGSIVLESNSVDCGYIKGTDEYSCSKWEVVDGYFCDNTIKYTREKLYLRDCDDCNNCSTPWIGQDVYRKGSTILEVDSDDCGFIIGSDDWDCEKWEVVDESEYYFCEEATKYKAEQRYVRNCSGGCDNCSEQWVATGVYRRSSIVIEYNSDDCGYYVPSTAWTCEEWRVLSGLNDYICEETTKYAKEQRYVRNCSGECSACTEDWVATGVFRRSTIVLEYNSEDCGYNPELSGNCVDWRWDDDVICDGFDKYQYLHKYVRECEDCETCSAYWIPTDIYKRGELVQAHSLDCGYLPGDNYVRWEIEDTQCYGYDLYEYWRKYVSEDNIQWYATDIYKQGDLIEENSFNCGYIPTEWTACTQWRAAGVICNGLDLYQRLRKFITEDCLTYYATAIFKKGNLIEENSIDCGYIPVANYIKWEEDDFICDGYDKYERLRKYISDDNIRWYMTEIFKRGNLIELNSFDCGYIPVENCYRWELAGTRCNGYDKYQNLVKVISDDCDERWYLTNITKTGELIETNSPDCGYKPSILYEYRWVATDATTCYRYDLVFQYKKQRRRLFYLSAQWQDVIPTEYSVDGAGTLPIRFAAKDTADCGYAPTVFQYINGKM